MKIAKSLVALGVVAGLGVASLPLSSYAAVKTGIKYVDGTGTDIETATEDDPITKFDGTKDSSVAGDILVKTTIADVLTITLEGNDDGHAVDTTERASHVVLLSTNPDDALDGKIMNGGNGTGAAKINVATNNLKGYNVTLKGSGDGSLVGTTNATEKIAPMENPATKVADGQDDDSEWGYKVTTTNSDFTAAEGPLTGASATEKKILQNYNPVSGSAAVIINRDDATQNAGDDFTLTFDVHASQSQAADTYTNTVTLTAAANNA